MMPAVQPNGIWLADLVKGLDYIGDLPDVELLGIAMDSRKIEDGFVFMACAGHRSHGLDFLFADDQRLHDQPFMGRTTDQTNLLAAHNFRCFGYRDWFAKPCVIPHSAALGNDYF